MSRDDQVVAAIAAAELERRRSLWSGRLTNMSGSTIIQGWAMPRAELGDLLLEAAFVHAPGMSRGEYLRLELEAYRLPGER